jgi:superfamily II DNA or RNA helicase
MSRQELKVTLVERLYVPRDAFSSLAKDDRIHLINLFQKKIYDPYHCEFMSTGRQCNKIEKAKEIDPSISNYSICRKCPLARITISCLAQNSKENWIAFNRGDPSSIKEVLETLRKKFKVILVDKRAKIPLKTKFKMRWEEMDKEKSKEQKRITDLWLKKKYGVIIAPPRYGKTLLTAMPASELGQRTAVFAHQIELLEQFQKDWLKFTTLKKSQIKINPKPEEVKDLSVCLYTYQQFISKYGDKRIKQLKNAFGFIVVDEIHKAASFTYQKVLNAFNSRYRLGVTATYKRRDQKEFAVKHSFGLPVLEGGSEQLACQFRECHTNWLIPEYKRFDRRTMGYLWKRLSSSQDRNEYIAKLAVRDIEKGHKIIIPVRYVKHIQELSKLIKAEAKKKGFLKIRICEYSSKLIAKNREEISEKVRQGFYDVVIAISSMVGLGFNCPPMSCLYMNVAGYSKDKATNYQLYSRIRTPFKNKNTPLIRIISDEGSMSKNAVVTLKKEFRKLDFEELKEIFNKRQEGL